MLRFAHTRGLGRAPRRPVQRAAFGTVFTGAMGQVVLLFSGVLVARLLGAEDRGQLALLALAPSLLAQVGTLGVPSAVTYYVALDTSVARAIARRIALLALVQSMVLAIINGAIAALLFAQSPPSVRIAAFATIVVIPGMILQQYGLAIMQGQGRFGAFNALRLSTGFSYAVAVGAFAAVGQGALLQIAYAWAAAYLGIGVLIGALVVRSLSGLDAGHSCPSQRELLAFGSKALFSGTSMIESFRIDQWIVGLFLTRASLGLYVIASAFTTLPHLLANSLGLVTFPHVAAQSRSGGGSGAMWRFVGVGVLAAALVISVLEVAVGRLVPFFFGSQFTDAVPAARLLLLASFFLAARRVLSDGLRGLGRPVAGTVAEISSWFVLVIAAIPLLPRFGLQGAAAAVVFASASSFFVLVITAIRTPLAGRARRICRAAASATAVPLVACAAGAGLPFVVSDGGGLIDYALAAAVIAVAGYPIARRALRGGLDIFEPIFLASLTLAIAFGVRPIAMMVSGEFTYYGGIDLKSQLTPTLWLVLVGTAAFVLGYEIVHARPLHPQRSHAIVINYDLLRGFLVFLSLLGLALFVVYLSQGGSAIHTFRLILQGRSNALYSIDTSTSEYLSGAPILLSCVGILLVLTSRGRMRLSQRVGVAAVIALPAVINAATGSRRFLIPTLALPVLVYYLRQRSRPSRRTIILLIPLTFLLLASIPSVRSSGARAQSGGLIAAVTRQVERPPLVAQHFLLGNDNEMFSALEVEVGSLRTPPDFFYGRATIGDMLLAPIPHVLFPSKPVTARDEMLIAAFGAPCKAVGGVCPDFSVVGSFYQDFWWIGVVVGMSLLGAASAAVWRGYKANNNHYTVLLAATWTVFLPIILRAGVWPGFAWFLYFFFPCALGLAFAGARSGVRAEASSGAGAAA